jgi:hypothetical protein
VLEFNDWELNELSNSMELSPSSEATSVSATQEFPDSLLNPKVHYYIHKSPPSVPTLSETNAVHTTPSKVSMSHFSVIITPTI